MIFESHAHYDDEAFNIDRNMLLNSLTENGIQYVVNVGANMKSSLDSVKLAKEYNFIHASVGVHPSETGNMTEKDYNLLKELALQNDKVVAIGEIGLDYYWDEPDRAVQKKWFERQLQLADDVKLPIIIHSRDAEKDTEDILKNNKSINNQGVIHCYSYSKESAKNYLEMGFYIGIGGVVTFKNAKKLKEVVEYTPIDRILLETDCPYLSPEPFRGKRNSSLNLTYVAKAIAELKGIEYEDVISITNSNAKKLYFNGRDNVS